MPIITPTDLGTHLYADVLNEIIRNDSGIAVSAINAAEQEAKMYLSRYDLAQLFGDGTTAATVNDEYLKRLIKDIACWHLLRLCNAGIDMTTARYAYEHTIKDLNAIQNAEVNPQDWPYNTDTSDSARSEVLWNSNPKRSYY